MTGADVAQLNYDLVALGYAAAAARPAGWDYFSGDRGWGGEAADAAGDRQPVGDAGAGVAVFVPVALRVAAVTGSLGGPASGPVLTGDLDQQVVTIALDAAQQTEVKAGDKVTITLPDGPARPAWCPRWARSRPGRAARRRSR